MSESAEIEALSTRVREAPGSLAFVALADALRRYGRHAEGLRVLREGFRAHPDLPAARVVLARIHLDMGNRALAEEVLSEVVAAQPDDLPVAAQLARLYVEDGRLADARPLLERLRAAGHTDAALPELSAAAPAGDDPFETPAIALRLARSGQYHRAWPLLERLAQARPGDPAVRAAYDAVERALAGSGDAPGERALEGARRPLPGLRDAWLALLDDTAERAPPAGDHPVARWGRRIWRAS